MSSTNHDKTLAQRAMDNLLVDFLCHEPVFEAVRVTQITRLESDPPYWFLWTEDNQGVYQLELQGVGQALCGMPTVAGSVREMEADFVIRFVPFAQTKTVAQVHHNSLVQ